jgi:hypothetical protein
MLTIWSRQITTNRPPTELRERCVHPGGGRVEIAEATFIALGPSQDPRPMERPVEDRSDEMAALKERGGI